MDFFSKSITKPFIQKNNVESILEIGASMGENTKNFLMPQIKKHVIIDPCIDCNLDGKFKSYPHVKVLKNISLAGLNQLSGNFNCIFIDGDHNWYTVYHELTLIHEKKLLSAGGVIFFHDVAWPYARRDMYYNPKQIPAEHRLPYAKKGIIKGRSQLSDKKGMNAHLDNALKEGGAKNGVLTAIEDFLKKHPGSYYFTIDHRQHGLGILISKKDASTFPIFIKLKLKIAIFELINPFKQFIITQLPSFTKIFVKTKHFIFKQGKNS